MQVSELFLSETVYVIILHFFLQELSLFVYFIRSNYSSGIYPKCTTRKELQMEPNYDPETDRK